MKRPPYRKAKEFCLAYGVLIILSVACCQVSGATTMPSSVMGQDNDLPTTPECVVSNCMKCSSGNSCEMCDDGYCLVTYVELTTNTSPSTTDNMNDTVHKTNSDIPDEMKELHNVSMNSTTMERPTEETRRMCTPCSSVTTLQNNDTWVIELTTSSPSIPIAKYIAGGVGGGVLLIVIIVICVCCFCKRVTKQPRLPPDLKELGIATDVTDLGQKRANTYEIQGFRSTDNYLVEMSEVKPVRPPAVSPSASPSPNGTVVGHASEVNFNSMKVPLPPLAGQFDESENVHQSDRCSFIHDYENVVPTVTSICDSNDRDSDYYNLFHGAPK